MVAEHVVETGTKQVIIRFPHVLHDALVEASKRDSRRVSDFVRLAVRDRLSRDGIEIDPGSVQP
jgi:hypothetical protein